MGSRHITSLVIAFGLSAAALGTHPTATARGRAESPPQERAISHSPRPQAPTGLDGTHPTRIGHYDRNHLGEAYQLATGHLAPTLGGGPVSTRSNLTAEQEDLVDHAVSLFDAAGLELHGIDFVGFSSRDDCFGRDGAAVSDGLRTEVRLCLTGGGPIDDWVALHEIGHAWDHGTLDEATRQEFLELRGLTAWREGNWHDRGAEHAAEILVWGLIDRPVVPGRIPDNSCDELLTAYRTLTGSDPLHGYTDHCEA